jgi:DNA uptake protein ComE-like DNA-binding protein
MAFTDELIERLGGATGAGVGAGLAALLLVPRVARPLGRGLRSMAKGAIKGYLVLSERTRSAVAEAGEELQQLYTEAQAEAGAAGRNGHDAQATRELQSERRDGETGRRGHAGRPAPASASEGAAEHGAAKQQELSSRPVAPSPARPVAPPAPREAESDRVNLNSADKEALMSLPGVGEKTAEKILQYRQEHGKIRSLDELHEADILFAYVAQNLRDRVTT